MDFDLASATSRLVRGLDVDPVDMGVGARSASGDVYPVYEVCDFVLSDLLDLPR